MSHPYEANWWVLQIFRDEAIEYQLVTYNELNFMAENESLVCILFCSDR